LRIHCEGRIETTYSDFLDFTFLIHRPRIFTNLRRMDEPVFVNSWLYSWMVGLAVQFGSENHFFTAKDTKEEQGKKKDSF